MNRLLVECSYVFGQPWVHAGIQRVVRNIAGQCIDTAAFGRPLLVAIGQDHLFEIDALLPSKRIGLGLIAKSFAWILRARAAVQRKLDNEDFLLLPFPKRLLLFAFSIFASAIVVLLRPLKLDPFRHRARRLEIHKGDTLLLLDASWHDPRFFQQVAEFRAMGVRIVAVVYDLIPIRHSEYCSDTLNTVFDGWFNRMTQLADAFVCISEWVATEVQDEIRLRIDDERIREKAFGWFHLGSELDRKTENRLLSGRIRHCFESGKPKFLVVGTIEPRKNHTLIIDAFEQHWAAGGQSRLCIIGRVGWMCEDIVLRLKSHPENGKRLFWFNNADDNELEFAYQNADALIFASFVEGFGLPLVEGLQRGLPAIASDIPVFREVAGDFAEYFDPNSASDLCAIIDQFSITKKLPNARSVTEWKWITWKESAQQLFGAVDQCCRELDERRSLSNAHQH